MTLSKKNFKNTFCPFKAIAQGYKILPCRLNLEQWTDKKTGKLIVRKAKSPYTSRGLYDASSDPKQIKAWLKKWPDCLWGVPCGPENNLFCVDLDPPFNMGPIDESLFEKSSFVQITPRQGKHGIFPYEDRFKIFKNSVGLGDTSLDIRTKGGFFIGYRELPPRSLELNPIPEAGFEGLKTLQNLSKTGKKPFTEGQRNRNTYDTAFAIAKTGKAVSSKEIQDLIVKAQKSNLPDQEIATSIQSAYTGAKESGIDPGPQAPPQETGFRPAGGGNTGRSALDHFNKGKKDKNIFQVRNAKDFMRFLLKQSDYIDNKKFMAEMEKVLLREKNKEDIMFETMPFTQVKYRAPIPFCRKILLDNEFNFMYGWPKIGKTRALLKLIIDTLEIKNKDLKIEDQKKCAVLSTDNDREMVLKPLFAAMGCETKFLSVNDALGKYWPDLDTKRLPEFLERVEIYIQKHPQVKCLLIDPLPRIIDYNQEQFVSEMVDGLRTIAKKYEVCIIGVRNEGKSKKLEGDASYKGSSAFVDDSRQSIRAIICHRKSVYALDKDLKEGKKEGKKEAKKEDKDEKPRRRVVLYSVFSSNFREQAFLFELRIDKFMDGEVAIPVLLRELNDPMDIVQYRASKESGYSLSNKMVKYMQKQSAGGCTLQDLYEAFDDTYTEDHIKRTAYRVFDHTSQGGVRYFMPKKITQKIP